MKNKFLSWLSPPERAAINLFFLVYPSKRRNCAYLCAECKYACTLFEVSIKAVMFHVVFFLMMFVFIHLVCLEDLLIAAHTDLPSCFSWLHRVLLYFIPCSLKLIFEWVILMIPSSKYIKSWAMRSQYLLSPSHSLSSLLRQPDFCVLTEVCVFNVHTHTYVRECT